MMTFEEVLEDVENAVKGKMPPGTTYTPDASLENLGVYLLSILEIIEELEGMWVLDEVCIDEDELSITPRLTTRGLAEFVASELGIAIPA